MTLAPVVPIYRGEEFYTPTFEVKVGDRLLERDVIRDITQVSYRDNIKEIDSFEITINNWDAEKRGFKYSDDHLFDPGKKVELWMGYFDQGRLRLMLTGEITSLSPKFPSAGQPTLVISGLNRMHSLRKRQESHSYTRRTDNQIAQEIGSRLGVRIHTEEDAPGARIVHNHIFQDNQYDILFLMERARRIGYDLFVNEEGQNGQAQPGELYFGPSEKVKRITYELKYGISLNEFSPTLTTANQVGQVTVRGWDAVRKQPITVTVNRSQLTTRGVGRAGGQQEIDRAFNEREEVIVDRPIHSRQEAETLARQTLEDIAKEMVKGSGSVVGLPDLRAGNVIQLSGMGERFGGRYFVTSTTHSISDSGYTTQFECRREETEEGITRIV
jgi:phage protein D